MEESLSADLLYSGCVGHDSNSFENGHFKDKDALFEALGSEAKAEANSHLQSACQSNGDNSSPVTLFELTQMQIRLEAKFEARMAAERQRFEDEFEHQDMQEELDRLMWNINAVSVLCWKANDEIPKKGKKRRRRGLRAIQGLLFDDHLLLLLFRFLPLVIVFFEVSILIGMVDQGWSLKRSIYGDGNYQSYLWRYSKEDYARDKFRTVFAQNGTRLGVTADFITKRPLNEGNRCLADDLFMPFNGYQWKDVSVLPSEVWPMINEAKKNASWGFTHCLPWEYAGLCSMVMRANQFAERAPANEKGKYQTWYPDACYLIGPTGKTLIFLDDWEGMSATPEEIRAAREQRLMPKRVEGRAEFILWVLTKVVFEAKTLDAFDDVVSLFLYSHTSHLYRLGYGQAYLQELITITVLSFFLFFTSFLDETQQLMHQVTLACRLRCWEDSALFHPGPEKSARRVFYAMERQLRKGRWHAAGKYFSFVMNDWFCDLFLSIRIMFLACMVVATEMIVTWDHGVLSVIFSTLAIAFLFEIDDNLMKFARIMGWKESMLYRGALEPLLDDMMHEDRIAKAIQLAEAARLRGRSSSPVRASSSADGAEAEGGWVQLYDIGRSWLVGLSFSEDRVMRVWAFSVCCCLFTVHQVQSYRIAVDAGSQDLIKSILGEIFFEPTGRQIASLSGGVFAAVFLNTLCYRGRRALPSLIALGLCCVWSYSVVENVTINGFLIWGGDDRPERDSVDHAMEYIFVMDAPWFFPALALHTLCVVLRPLVAMARVSRAVAAADGAADVENQRPAGSAERQRPQRGSIEST